MTRNLPDWVRCRVCGILLYGKRLVRNLQVCPECGDHRRLTAWQRIDQLADADSFEPLGSAAQPADVLGFVDTRPYPARLDAAQRKTGLDEAVVCGTAKIGGHPLVMAVMDFEFLGGSLGSAVGARITEAAEKALAESLPFLVVTASGGARMQEGCISLMQMVPTSQAIARLRDAGLLTVSLITDPTYGGVAASFATNTDVLIAESGARMGFAGPRVIEQTIREDLPDGFQTAEFLLEHGQVDIVLERRALRGCLQRLLDIAGPRPGTTGDSTADSLADEDSVLVRDPERLPSRDPWEVVQTVRDVDRPTTLDYIHRIFDSFVELRGDRRFGDCSAVVAGLARTGDLRVAVVGHQKGHNTRELVGHNFGMPRPEGYRKALRVEQLAARLGLPVVTFVDTPGAHPGIEAEERGQALAIADCIQEMSELRTPIVTVVTGEGGSGGALALAAGDRVLVAEHGTYSVISPEGCSAILWNTAEEAPRAAEALKITAPELLRLGVADAVVPEPPGGAQADATGAAMLLRSAIHEALDELRPIARSSDKLVEARRNRFRQYCDVGEAYLASRRRRTRPGEAA